MLYLRCTLFNAYQCAVRTRNTYVVIFQKNTEMDFGSLCITIERDIYKPAGQVGTFFLFVTQKYNLRSEKNLYCLTDLTVILSFCLMSVSQVVCFFLSVFLSVFLDDSFTGWLSSWLCVCFCVVYLFRRLIGLLTLCQLRLMTDCFST